MHCVAPASEADPGGQGKHVDAPGCGEYLPAGFDVTSTSVRREFVRARKQGSAAGLEVVAYPNQSSGVLSSACWGDGLAVVPEHTAIRAGDLITYYPFTELLS